MKKLIKNYLKILKEFSPKQEKEYINLTLPIVMQINGGLLDLRIIPCKTCYKLCCLDNLFLETNRNLEWYYKTFHKYDKNYHYDIKLSDNIFYKEFDKEFNIIVAISEFVHFFVLLDEFIINNAVIGNEENFD